MVNEPKQDGSACCQDSESCRDLGSFFTRYQWLAYALIVIAGVLMRWLELDVRPYHHDESQHAMFGKYFYDFPEIQFYKYDPMMHGPLLYNFMRIVYTALGNTLWSARVPIAIIGTLFIFVPLLFRKYFSATALLVLTAAISLSPTMVYWSRFLIHDYFVLLAQLITLYGVIAAKPQQKSFFVLLGVALQFCIKANVFVTLAIILGYLLFEALFRYFVRERESNYASAFFNYLIRNILIFLAGFAILTIGAHRLINFAVTKESQHWAALLEFSQNIGSFILVCFAISAAIYLSCFFLVVNKDYYLRKTFQNIWQYKSQFIVACMFAALALSYIVSSGFRHIPAILDLIFRTSIPYWLNQHNIERITGPFLFNFYMLSWYELVFVIFLFIQTYLFYSTAPKLAKRCGWGILALASVIGLFFLIYTRPDSPGGYFKSIADLGKRPPAEMKSFIDVLATHYVGFFKLKDCLDAFAVILIILHPLILCSTHLARRESTLAFWGYLFTATFFSYSYLGEKVPWLSMYPLVTGFIYLTLFFDDWFHKNPISNYKDFPLARIFRSAGLITLFFAIIFVLEEMISLSSITSNFSLSTFLDLYRQKGIGGAWDATLNGMKENIFFFVCGFTLYFLSYVNRWTNLLGTVNLKVFLFIIASLFCIRSSILTNFVYAGSETEFISQVHTTKDFHELMLSLRQKWASNLREEPFKVLGDGDPVWPMTWYFVGIPDFKWQASPEERKGFDVIIQTYEETPKNLPDGWEKKRINLRGWWVPDYNQMTLKKFLNVSVNHIPWSNSGFTYVWLFSNPARGNL